MTIEEIAIVSISKHLGNAKAASPQKYTAMS